MSNNSPLLAEFVQDYGEAYRLFGLPRLMGQIVALLLYEREPISLDDITTRLQVSKGPVSQIMRRLREHRLVEKRWVPGSRRDYYAATPDIFGQAFANHAALLERNLTLARDYASRAEAVEEELPEHFQTRIAEMEEFYERMVRQLQSFLVEWQEQWQQEWRERVQAGSNGPTRADEESRS